jgi:hypothetical protein
LSLLHSMQACRRSRGIAPLIPDCCTEWRWVVCFVPKLLYLWGDHRWCPLNRRLGGPQSWCEHFGEYKHLLLPLEFELCPIKSIGQLLYWLIIHGSYSFIYMALIFPFN